jgi:hypothetical protein
VAFLAVYIKEAHPTDEWQMASNEKEGVCYPQPRTMAQRVALANDFVHRFAFPIPVLVDAMDNRAMALYAGWPERLYILSEQGTVLYKGNPGPFGYEPEQVARWLQARVPGR